MEKITKSSQRKAVVKNYLKTQVWPTTVTGVPPGESIGEFETPGPPSPKVAVGDAEIPPKR